MRHAPEPTCAVHRRKIPYIDVADHKDEIIVSSALALLLLKSVEERDGVRKFYGQQGLPPQQLQKPEKGKRNKQAGQK